MKHPALPRACVAAAIALSFALLLAACGKTDEAAPKASAPNATSSAASNASPNTNSAEVVDAAAGEALYKKTCFVCHDTGAAGAPRKGDKAAWAPRIAQGQEALYHAALKGLNAMPPRGNSAADDAHIKAAVDYMVATSR